MAPRTTASDGNADALPWQEKTVPAEGADKTVFYDNVVGVLRRHEPMRITPESVREVIRVMAMIRKGTNFPSREKSHERTAATPTA